MTYIKPMMLPRARIFACFQHMGQTRKYTGEPYVYHPAEVVHTLACLGFRPAVLAAAWLHDVVEDCGVTRAKLVKEFGEEVAALVLEVSDVSKRADGNRKVRKEIDRQHLAKASPDGQSIKLADLIDNTKSIVAHDPNFAVVYLQEKRALLKVLTRGHPDLIKRARQGLDTQ